MTRRGALRGGLLAAALLAAIAAGVPFVRVPWLAGPFERSLESALARNVEFAEVRLSLFPAPSVVASQVVIAEDPAFGLEPFAYADELRAALRLAALLRGRIEPSALRLTGASLNLARSGPAGFNLAAFLQKSLADPRKSGKIPEFSLRQSRINFREGVQKSAYYLNGVDLDLEPPDAPGGALQWRYEASPARTDRAEQGFGRFSGSGRWIPGGQGGRFAIDVALERSSVSELLLLLAGRDLGLQGRFVARAFLDGPLHDLQLRGSLEMEDIDRPGLLGLRAQRYQLPLRGRLDLDRQSLELSSAPPEKGKPALPLLVRLEGQGLLSVPRWTASLGFDALPAEALLDFCRRLGLEPPADLHVDARVSGSASFATAAPAAGEIHAAEASLRLGDSPPVRAQDGLLRLEGERLLLERVRLIT
ncbi:MAG: AsmA family protein, partial [Bryobacteraceae bacterium]|nr:AsmA family protein [Bryobacteraceae bacterium]